MRIARPTRSRSDAIEQAVSAAPHVTWIGIGEVTWPVADVERFLEDCIVLLKDEGIHQVDVETCTSRVVPLLAPPFLPEDLRSTGVTRQHVLPLRLGVGLNIAPHHRPDAIGSSGPFLRLGGDQDLYLLTARHCVADKTSSSRALIDDETPETRICVMGCDTFRQLLGRIADSAESENDALVTLSRMTAERDLHDDLSSASRSVERLHDLHADLRSRIEDRASRVIGMACCYSKLGVNTAGMPGGRSPLDQSLEALEFGWTEDWALIRINPGLVEPTDIPNLVPFDPVGIDPDHPARHGFPRRDAIQLRHLCPLSELEARNITVVKRGARTGQTVGVTSPFRSCARTSTSDSEGRSISTWNWDLPIFGLPEGSPFSQTGDSGACAVEAEGGVVGMITRGLAGERGVDITLLTPMEVIFARIQQMCGQQLDLA